MANFTIRYGLFKVGDRVHSVWDSQLASRGFGAGVVTAVQSWSYSDTCMVYIRWDNGELGYHEVPSEQIMPEERFLSIEESLYNQRLKIMAGEMHFAFKENLKNYRPPW